jgi:enoyl reductase-like protein
VEKAMYQELIVRLNGLKAGVSELKADVPELKTRVIRIEKKQDTVSEQTAGLLEFRTETLNRLHELQDNQISVSAILGQHEMQIRSLQRR